MIGSLLKALGQMDDPRFRRVMWLSVLYSLVLLVVLVVLAGWALSGLALSGLGWLDGFVTVLGSAAAAMIALLLFPGAAMLVASLLLEDIVRAVEDRHYPGLPPARPQPLGEMAWSAMRLLVLTVALNVLLLPVYLVPGLNVFVFFLVNGYLLGREYFELVAARRMEPGTVKRTWRAQRARLYSAGAVIALLLSIPLVNWLMPVIAAAFMTHEFESLRRKLPRD